MEQWKCFLKFNDKKMRRYSGFKTISHWVSNLGNIKTVREKPDGKLNERPYKGICRQYKNRGYMSFRVRDKSYRVHRVVAENFVPGRTEGKNVIDHIDDNELNNNANNLRWVTQKENVRKTWRVGRRKRTLSEDSIRKLKKEIYSDTIKNLAEKYKCSNYIVADVRRGRIYTFPVT